VRGYAQCGEAVKHDSIRSLIVSFALLVGGLSSLFAAPMAPGSCEVAAAEVCLDSTPCKNISGITACLSTATNIPKDAVVMSSACWQYRSAFNCTDPDRVSSCKPLRDKGCGQINTQCISTAPDGTCASSTLTFRCEDKPASVRRTNVCETALCQANGSGCFDTTRPEDKDFGKAVAMMEATREAGIYGADLSEFFKGFGSQCAVKVLADKTVRNCCKAAGGGGNYTNYAVIGLGAKAAFAVGKVELAPVKESIVSGSKYVYDSLFQSQAPELVEAGAAAAASGLAPEAVAEVSAQAGATFGAYGFEFAYMGGGEFTYVGFDPSSFALSVAMLIVTEWLGCEPEEQITQMKRGQGLCAYIESKCSKAVLGSCVEKTEQHCCFNSVLAKVINRQGRSQLGLPADQCSGFTEAQLLALDFSAIDFTEFIESIAPKAVDQSAAEQGAKKKVDKSVSDYYGKP
jgi:conjugal transfer mating pair stabilization protein TraN